MPTPTVPEPTPAPLPTVREFRAGAHQALIASNGRDPFYLAEIQRAIAGDASPLARFLPAATYSVTARAAGTTGGGARVSFAFSPEIVASGRQLRAAGSAAAGSLALPKAEIEAFATAVTQFMSMPAGLTPLAQQCRREFRLPDPVREPDAYWVVGTGFDRRLVILWGCERYARTSVPLDRVVQHLRTCEMAWEDKQQLALQLALRKEEPLSKFICLPTKAADGFILSGETLPPKALKKFDHFGQKAWSAYDLAAKAFIAKANDEATSLFEAELRREFRLPSVAAVPARFYRHGTNVLIDASPLELAKSVPPAPLSDDANEETPPLNQQLARRVKFQGMPLILAAAAALVVGLGVVGYFLLIDNTPPKFVELKPVGPTTVALVFSEPMRTPETGAVSFVGKKPAVKFLRVDTAAPTRILVEVDEPLKDGEEYGIDMSSKLTDRAGNKLPQSDFKFPYYDAVAPKLVEGKGVSAGGMSPRDLVLSFDKPIDKDSLTTNAFKLAPFSGGETGKNIPIADAKFDPDVKDGTRVIVTADEDLGRPRYVLSIRGLTGISKSTNKGNVRVEIENHQFDYKDILPPTIRTVVGSGLNYTVQIEFSKPLDPKVALQEANYKILRPGADAKPQPIVAGGVKLDDVGKVLTLSLERGPLTTGKHHLVVTAAVDRQGNSLEGKKIERDFEFSDAAQRGAPKITKIDADDSSPRLTLEFDRGVGGSSVKPERFRILTGDRSASDFTVSGAVPTTEDARKVVLTLSAAPKGGTLYYVRTDGLEDVFGTKQDAAELKDFRPIGAGRSQTNLILSRNPVLLANNKVQVLFDNVISRTSAENKDNYIIIPAGPAPQVEYQIDKGAAGAPSSSSVILTFAAPVPAELRIGARSLQIEGDATGSLYQIRPRPAQPKR